MTSEVVRTPSALECQDVTVSYAARSVLRGLTLTVDPAEAVAVLGPSGCGKTTLLYAIAGFVNCAGGSIRIGGRLVADERFSGPPERRHVGVVFQNYALWPHLTALDNVAYPVRRGGASRADARRTASTWLTRMGVSHLAGRRPAELSGGEQQRVGVARALAGDSALYLFDEPTAHLDTVLRAVLQEELAAQRSALGAAVLYATHDVAEAFAVADRVALLRDGEVLQVGAPQDVYERPVDLWAARLTGSASVLELPVVPVRPGVVEVSTADGTLTVPIAAAGAMHSGPCRLLMRPEWGELGGPLPGRVTAVRYRGADTDYRLETPVGTVEVRERGAPRAAVGSRTGWTLTRGWLLDSGSGGPPS
jgi:iron(III) transport system ATP-binding protein